MTSENDVRRPESMAVEGVEQDRQLILDAKKRGTWAKIGAYTKLSGPGWLQSAITLGSGSLAGSLYLGVLGGFSLLWLQPLAMVLGVIMLSAIGYVVLSTGEKPFHSINRHVSYILGWSWALATMMANLVWSLPQFSVGAAALRQNLIPGLIGEDAMGSIPGRMLACAFILIICVIVVWFYDSGRKGIRIFEYILKAMVGLVIICFFGVVIRMTLTGALPWGTILASYIPNPAMLFRPSYELMPLISQVATEYQDYWRDLIVFEQRDVMITVTATAVGINMTFLLPYSMLRKGWDKDFRGLAIFDLATGLFIPFILATSCVVIASATQFHGQPSAGLLGEVDEAGNLIEPAPGAVQKFERIAAQRVRYELGDDAFEALSDEERAEHIAALPEADKRMAAVLVDRDAFDLASSLAPLTGDVFAQYIFGIGVVAMAISSVIILMLINGFVICEIFGLPQGGWPHRIGSLMPAVGALAPFIWTGGRAQMWLAVPTSVFGMALIPIAYCTFFLLMNQRELLGDRMPTGTRRVRWNVLMGIAIVLTGIGSIYAVHSRLGLVGVGIIVLLVAAILIERQVRGLNKI